MRTSFLMAVIYTALAVSSQATLIAHWDLDEASSLYANTVPAGPLLTQDVATDAAGTDGVSREPMSQEPMGAGGACPAPPAPMAMDRQSARSAATWCS